jgi:hypothetical protein
MGCFQPIFYCFHQMAKSGVQSFVITPGTGAPTPEKIVFLSATF